MLHEQPIYSPVSVITAVCVLVCQVQIDCVSILMYIVALDRIYRHLGKSEDISGKRRGYLVRDGHLGGETVVGRPTDPAHI